MNSERFHSAPIEAFWHPSFWLFIFGLMSSWTTLANDFDINRQGRMVSLMAYEPGGKDRRCLPTQNIFKTIKLTNASPLPVKSSLLPGERGVNLAYRFYRGDDVAYESDRVLLDPPLKPGSERFMALEVQCPKEPGSYELVIDLVQEGINWNHIIQKNEGLFLSESWTVLAMGGERPPDVLDVAKVILDPSLGFWPDSRKIWVSMAGSQYPQVWARDMATIQRGLVALRANPAWQSHWTELFMERFDPKMGVPDWRSPLDGKMGKNTITSDQELWVVLGALEAVEAGFLEHDWLTRWRENLEEVMTYALDRHWQSHEGCLASGHTLDWGDVGLMYEDDRSTKAHGIKVCSLYSQSLLYQVLGAWSSYVGPTIGSISAEVLQEQVRAFAEETLWQPDRGFYKVHHHLSPLKHSFDEDDLLALGGHVLGLEGGLIPSGRRKRFLEVYLKRRESYGAKTLGAVLLPPYPKDTFQNPIMDEEFEYQNGGIWDWYGPRMVFQLASLDPRKAKEEWGKIDQLVRQHGSFYEWVSIDGRKAVGPHYRASAAAYLWARSKMVSLTHSKNRQDRVKK